MAADKPSSRGQFRIIFVIIVGIAAIILVVQNLEPVETRFLTFSATMPRAVLLGITAAVSFLAGLVAAGPRRK